MNVQMAYLLGMITGNGEIQRGATQTTIVIEIPHKKLETEFQKDVAIYVKASITDIRQIIEQRLVVRHQRIRMGKRKRIILLRRRALSHNRHGKCAASESILAVCEYDLGGCCTAEDTGILINGEFPFGAVGVY